MGNIHTSGEDYLETILVLWNKQNGEVRSIDVARELNVTKPSVSNAMKILREESSSQWTKTVLSL